MALEPSNLNGPWPAIRLAQSNLGGLQAPAKAARVLELVGKAARKHENFLGTQPRITQVPPTRYSSATATLAP